MKAITIKQPWASLIVCGVKDIENRTWLPYDHLLMKGRFDLLIHSSSRRDTTVESKGLPDGFYLKKLKGLSKASILGHIIGKVTVDCQEGFIHPDNIWAIQGHKQWKLIDAVAFEKPIPAKGRLGIWNFDKPELISITQ